MVIVKYINKNVFITGRKEVFYLAPSVLKEVLKEHYLMEEEGGNVLFIDTLNTFSYGYMASDIW